MSLSRPLRCLSLAALTLSASATDDDAWAKSQPVQEFEVDLDKSPEDRFTEVATHFNSSIWKLVAAFDHFPIRNVCREWTEKRGNETDELQREINGVAATTKVPTFFLNAVAMLYEVNTLMVPIHNITLPQLPIPMSGPACTGIIANNKDDNSVYHARNLDFSPAEYLQDLVYTGIFKKGGEELFRAQMVAGYSFPLTALKKGADGFSYEINTRFLDHEGGNGEMWKNMFDEKRPLNGWTARKAIETSANYEDFVKAMSTTPLVATVYNVISGVKKGTILARNPDDVAYQMTLGKENYQCRDDYIIITNFDFFYHDIREWFDPTGGKGIGHPRRIAAQKLLNASSSLTPEVLMSTISEMEVMAKDTIFQAIINVEKGIWQVGKPACTDCPKPPSAQAFLV
mmetsp:Transcript_63609/g.138465  ORF Transcript_63609/g.138465 Transcript_63609/m.138465 type:complete len:400 (-) Transcript_63609:211-1410(-)